MLVPGRAVGVAVDEPRIAVLAQHGLHRTGVDVHERWRLAFFLRFTRPAQRLDSLFALPEWQCKKVLSPGGRTHLGAKLLIVDVVGAKRVAVHEQRARPEQIE